MVYTGSSRSTRVFNPATQKWSSTLATTNYTGTRKYGTSVLLPLSPADGYKARVIIMGGGNPATRTRYDHSIEIYTPAYLFDGDGNPAVRPSIADTPATVFYGNPSRLPRRTRPTSPRSRWSGPARRPTPSIRTSGW